jgi:enoyl-CoA hydratase/3-hydroxyacyl-CoA dehydrogenase
MTTRSFGELAVIGAGNMGSGIAQKMATEGFQVTLVDLDDEKVARGLAGIAETLDAGVERKIFSREQADGIRSRVRGSTDWSDLAHADLVVEAVFEDLEVKREVFRRLEENCREDAILATNTSSFFVRDIAATAKHPERIVGLHYFYHPAKNRLVEVVPGERTAPEIVRDAWSLQEQIGKTPIAAADAPGFVVNRYFVPWLNEAVRLLAEEVADIPTIEAACKQAFGVGLGPFELMNVTGVPIALHAATTLGEQFGPLYAPDDRLRGQVEAGRPWELEGEADATRFDAVTERMLAVVFHVAAALVDEGVGTIEDTDIGARVGLRWPRGPFQMLNRYGVRRGLDLVRELGARWDLEAPRLLVEQAANDAPFRFEFVRSETADGVAHLTINRPDAMNALNETVVEQLHRAFREAAADPEVRGIVIGGAGKAFIAGADIRLFVRGIESGDLDGIVEFTRNGHALLDDIDRCEKPVVARLHGLALGGGLELALACGAIIAGPRAQLAFPETGIGIYPGLGGTQRLPRRIGKGLAKWLIYSGQMLTANEARAIGLVDSVVPHESLDTAIGEAIERHAPGGGRGETPTEFAGVARLFEKEPLAALLTGETDTGGNARSARAVKALRYKAPIALRLSEELIDDGLRGSLQAGLELELSRLTEIFGTKDAHEGLSSLGRRRPEFKGN